jgi:hypothetical protein
MLLKAMTEQRPNLYAADGTIGLRALLLILP